MIRINQLKIAVNHTEAGLQKKAAGMLGIRESEMLSFSIVRRSLDARKKPELFYNYIVDVETKKEKQILKKGKDNQIIGIEPFCYQFPYPEKKEIDLPPVVVGSGPGGLFCSYFLALSGYRPILLERGEDVDGRRKQVEAFWKGGVLLPHSNVQFGEGGAGTFSDGKLNTLVKDKSGRNRAVLETFVAFGAPESILYDAKPHIGTDILCGVVKRMREEIIRLGGDVRFQSQVTNLIVEKGRVAGVEINGQETISCHQVVFAIGHSARDTFYMLHERGVPMESKAFAVGFRVEHLQEKINLSQYGMKEGGALGAASYKLTAKTSVGRSVYSFCMCPGGYVVNASSEDKHLAVNGMSYSDRKGQNANSAIVVAVTQKDFSSAHPLAGIAFQRELERRAYLAGEGKIPLQRYGDFRERCTGKTTDFEPECEALTPAIKGQYLFSDLTDILPMECNLAFVEGMEQFGKQIKGFNHGEVLLSGVESRTSSPVRILRGENLQSEIEGLYPCGEGAGYAGGITSAAMDGIRVAEAVVGVKK